MDILKIIQQELEVKLSQVEAAVRLIDEGNTIPFIARYRKEATGALNDEQLRKLNERLQYLSEIYSFAHSKADTSVICRRIKAASGSNPFSFAIVALVLLFGR